MPREDTTPPKDLQIDLAALRRQGADRHPVECELPAAWLGAVLGDTDAEVERTGTLKTEVQLQADGLVLARGRLSFDFSVPCGRCLDPAAVDGGTEIVATFVREPREAGFENEGVEDAEEGIGLTEEDLDTWLYDGRTLRLDQVVAEYVKLAYPMRALCPRGESCRGLCTSCGAPLNEQPPSRRCRECGTELEGIAVGPLPEGAEPTEGPLAEALRKLDLPD